MNKGQKVALKHAANAIEGLRPAIPGGIRLGATNFTTAILATDRHDRPFPSTYLAQRAGRAPTSHIEARRVVEEHFGLSNVQAVKLDKVAASTHNVKQRAGRVARFLRRIAENPEYTGLNRAPTAWLSRSFL